ncbi:ribosome maturation factor RimP [Phytohabitans sp. ZYX-F-186]|uniref:Ribosome maturation factor RimP n=1 Tax=Phytohabitans maris TaxID=3071409 RepID=A0ABU0ZJV1_9ACTN|nr:ribosome maturation factor RimP [Phytohabitans sp. ZYX-F-186]MDQ7907324.1 ribosome maturation factor RimP [Phytohabitans sp. ZYX-F-186]
MTQRGRTTPSRSSGDRRRPPAGADRTPQPRVSKERVAAVVRPVVTAAGYDLEDLAVSRAGRRHVVRVTIDGDRGVSLDDIADVSRTVSAALDAAEETEGDLLPGEYELEVSSRGVDRPLTLPRHWRRNVGRLVKASVAGRQVTGRIKAAGDDGVTLDVDGTVQEVAHADLGPGRVQLEFTRWGEVEGADEDDEIDEIDEEDEER